MATEIEVSKRCNWDCIHCFNANHIDEGLSFDEISSFMSEARSCLGGSSILFSGGEPLLRKDIKELIIEAHKLGYLVDLNTNAALVDKGWVDFFNSYRVVNLYVSVYTLNEKKHDSFVKKKGAFKDLMAGLSHLQKFRGKVHLSFLLTRIKTNWKDIYNFCEENGFIFKPSINILNNEKDMRAGELYSRIEASNDQKMKFTKELIELQRTKNPSFGYSRQDLKKVPCGIGASAVYLEANGNLYPCVHYHESMGNIKDKSLADILKLSPLISKMRSTPYGDAINKEDSEVDDSLLEYNANCYARNYMQTGDPFKVGEKDKELAMLVKAEADLENR